jgi:cytochrome c2
MTRSVTVDSTISDKAGTDARAPTAGGTFGVGESGKSAESTGKSEGQRPGEAAAASGSSPAPSGGTLTPPADAARGRVLVASGTFGCTACHIIPGIRSPRGIVGPSLEGFDQRPFIAGQLPNRPDVLAAFLQNPPSLVPATGMPNVGLNLEQARHIAAYLYTLKATPQR